MAFSIAGQRGRVEGLRDDQVRLGNRQPGQLVQRHLRAVRLDVHRVEQARRRAPRADVRQLLPHVLHAAVHPRFHFAEQALEVFRVH
jgi:hypothetical protein